MFAAAANNVSTPSLGRTVSQPLPEADELMQGIHRPTSRDAVSDDLQRWRDDFQRPPASAERRHDRARQHAQADDLVLVLHHGADPHPERSGHPRVEAERQQNGKKVMAQIDLEDELSEQKEENNLHSAQQEPSVNLADDQLPSANR